MENPALFALMFRPEALDRQNLNDARGNGTANTNIIRRAGRYDAIVEAGNYPIELDENLETIARSDFGGALDDADSGRTAPARPAQRFLTKIWVK